MGLEAQTLLGCPALLPCPPSPGSSSLTLLVPGPAADTAHILKGEECHLASYLPPAWLAGEGDRRSGGEVNLIVVLYGHLNLPGLPPRAKNNPRHSSCVQHTERTRPSALVQNPASVCQSLPLLSLHPCSCLWP